MADPLAAELARIAARHGLTGDWQRKPVEPPRPHESLTSPDCPSPSSESRREAWKARQTAMRRMDAFAASGVPFRHRERTNPEWPGETWEHARRAVEAGGTVALVGRRGTGKTQLGTELIRWVTLERGRTGWYTRADDLFDAMRAEMDGGARGRVLQRSARVGLLVIDELQVRFDSAFEDRELTRVIDKRYCANLPSVLIANLTPEAFWKSVGPSVGDRMREGGTVIVCDWDSFRGNV